MFCGLSLKQASFSSKMKHGGQHVFLAAGKDIADMLMLLDETSKAVFNRICICVVWRGAFLVDISGFRQYDFINCNTGVYQG